MAAIKSAYLRTKVIEHVLGINAFTMPTDIYLALYTSDPTVDDTGTEVTGGSYARQLVSWGAESGGVVLSDTDITFNSLPAGTVTHWALRDASSGGNLLYFGPMTVPIVAPGGEDLTIIAGNLSAQEK